MLNVSDRSDGRFKLAMEDVHTEVELTCRKWRGSQNCFSSTARHALKG